MINYQLISHNSLSLRFSSINAFNSFPPVPRKPILLLISFGVTRGIILMPSSFSANFTSLPGVSPYFFLIIAGIVILPFVVTRILYISNFFLADSADYFADLFSALICVICVKFFSKKYTVVSYKKANIYTLVSYRNRLFSVVCRKGLENLPLFKCGFKIKEAS